MNTWKSKICRGMDVVETITFVREGLNQHNELVQTSAVYVPGSTEQKPREQWTQAEIDAIADKLVNQLDETILVKQMPSLK